jgi:hypothetical protein
MRRGRHSDAGDFYGGADRTPAPLFDRPQFDRAERRADPFADSRLEPDSDEYRLMAILARHRGRANPCPLASLRMQMAGLARREFSEREIKGLVERLRLDHSIKIGSRRSEPFGYFLCVDAADVAEAIEPYKKQIFSMLRVMHVFCSKAERLELAGQARLALGGEGDDLQDGA